MLYIFCGNDYEAIKTKYDLLVNAQGLNIRTFDTVADMCTTLYQKSLIFGSTGYCVRYDDSFLKATDAWQDFLEICKTKTVILIYQALEKTTKFYKFFSKYILDFKKDEENIIFQFTRLVCLGKLDEALTVAKKIRPNDTIGTFSVLYSRIRKLLQIQATPKDMKLSVNTGLADYERQYNKNFLYIYSDDELAYMLELIEICSRAVKNGVLPSDFALLYFVIKMC